ncbi:Protein of unknown function [Pyronema omphalodes CBS 100304]|uniref:Uncharacterized protein n=1 Tax=Pyronema omphalodes (strain CBS 100304) TaxID=1076935 RepID=U4LLW8_PYROM|nr:Protein of unknown function [Pyronema omphalodes CBS 100304]
MTLAILRLTTTITATTELTHSAHYIPRYNLQPRILNPTPFNILQHSIRTYTHYIQYPPKMNSEKKNLNKNAVGCVLRITQQRAFDLIHSTASVDNINLLTRSSEICGKVESQYSFSAALGDQFEPSIDSQRIHEETTEFARSVLADMVMAIPVTSNYSTETVSSWSSMNDEEVESALSKYRYSPYFEQGVKFDSAIDWIRVKIFRREPISCDTRHREKILRDAIKAKYSPRGKCSAIKLNLRRWSLSPGERYELCEKYKRCGRSCPET